MCPCTGVSDHALRPFNDMVRSVEFDNDLQLNLPAVGFLSNIGFRPANIYAKPGIMSMDVAGFVNNCRGPALLPAPEQWSLPSYMK